MKIFIIMKVLLSISFSFCHASELKSFIQCKKDIKLMRSTYVEAALEDEPPLKDYLLRVFGLEGVQSWALNSFYFRPWLSKVKVTEKLKVCSTLRSEMDRLFVEPIGIDDYNRNRLDFAKENSSIHLADIKASEK